MTGSVLPKDIVDVYPLSDVEMGMLFHSLTSPGVYHNQEITRIKDRAFAEETLKKAFALLVEKHPILRTSFNLSDFDEPVQFVHQKAVLDIRHYDISHLKKAEQEEYVKDFLLKDRQNPFTIGTGKTMWRLRTFALDHENICVAWISHHAIIDGWSCASLLTELNNTYLALKRDLSFVPGELASTYKEFVIEQVVEKKKKANIEFWKNELRGYKKIGFFGPVKKDDEPGEIRNFLYHPAGELLEKLKNTAKTYKTSVKNLCFAGYLYMINMLSYDNDITVGMVTNSRPQCKDGDKIIGCFLNTVPVRIKIPPHITWGDYIVIAAEKMRELKKYERIPLFEIARIIGEKTRGENPVFDTLFNFVDFHVLDRLDRDHGNDNDEDDLYGKFSVKGHGTTNTLFDVHVSTTAGHFIVSCSYSGTVLNDKDVEKLCIYFEVVLDNMIAEPGTFTRKENLLPLQERRELLYELNDTQQEYPGDRTIQRMFEDVVENRADHIALVYGDRYLTYRELNEKANGLAVILEEKGAAVGTIVGIAADRSIELMIGILALLKVGGAYLPIDPDFPVERKKYILKDSNAALLLSREPVESSLADACDTVDLSAVDLYGKEAGNPGQSNSPGALAYVMYTSGSTGKPKAVAVEHGSVVNILWVLFKEYPFLAKDAYLLKTSLLFDVSVTELFGWFMGGGRLVVMERGGEKDPRQILTKIHSDYITHINFVPSMFNAFVDILSAGDTGKLSGLKYIFLAGEPVLPESIKKFERLESGVILENIYGPTEAAVYASKFPLGQWPGSGSIPIGKPLGNVKLYILDRGGDLQPRGVPGELCIGGVGVARGYLNRPEMTADRFISISNRSYRTYIPSQKIYKTGDLARWMTDGNIEFFGRIDHQVKIRGFRVEPGEIESKLVEHGKIKEAVVVARDEHLCAYITADIQFSVPELREYLSRELPEYMIPSYFMQLERIPLSPGGKVDRASLPLPEVKISEKYIGPRDELEKKLVDIWSQVLEIKKDILGIDSNFFHLGGHSLRATVLAAKLNKAFNVKIELGKIFKNSTIRKLSQYMKGLDIKRFVPVEPVEKKEYYPLSPAQKSLYIQQQMDNAGTAYNIPAFLELQGPVAAAKSDEVFRQLIRRHEGLRTSFQVVKGEPVQRIHEEVVFEPGYSESTEEEVEALIRSFITPFSLDKAPLMRVELVKIREEKYILMVDLNHIIADGSSVRILEREFAALYAGLPLARIRIQYKDFSQWQNRLYESGEIKKQESYWLEELAGEIPPLDLPLDYPRPAEWSFKGRVVELWLDKGETGALQTLASEENVTMFMLLFALYNVFLSRLSGREDIVVGVGAAGRGHADLQGTLGMFINMLAIRNYPQNDKTFKEFLGEVKDRTIKAFENQDYPLEKLVEKIAANRNTSRKPLFDVDFGMDVRLSVANEIPRTGIPGLKVELYAEKDNEIANSDFFLRVRESGGRILLRFQYDVELFKRQTMENYLDYYRMIVRYITGNKEIRIGDLELVEEEEKSKIRSLVKKIKEIPQAEFDI